MKIRFLDQVVRDGEVNKIGKLGVCIFCFSSYACLHQGKDSSRKVFKLEASNLTEMFDGSTTFVKTVWRFFHIDGSQIKKTAISYKKIIFSSFS